MDVRLKIERDGSDLAAAYVTAFLDDRFEERRV